MRAYTDTDPRVRTHGVKVTFSFQPLPITGKLEHLTNVGELRAELSWMRCDFMKEV